MQQNEVVAKAEVCTTNLMGTKRYMEKDGSQAVGETVVEEGCQKQSAQYEQKYVCLMDSGNPGLLQVLETASNSVGQDLGWDFGVGVGWGAGYSDKALLRRLELVLKASGSSLREGS